MSSSAKTMLKTSAGSSSSSSSSSSSVITKEKTEPQRNQKTNDQNRSEAHEERFCHLCSKLVMPADDAAGGAGSATICSALTCQHVFCSSCVQTLPTLSNADDESLICWCCKRSCPLCAPKQNKEFCDKMIELLEYHGKKFYTDRKAILASNRRKLRQRLAAMPNVTGQNPLKLSVDSWQKQEPKHYAIPHTEVLPRYQYYIPLRRNFYEEDAPELEYYPARLCSDPKWVYTKLTSKYHHVHTFKDDLTYTEECALAELLKVKPTKLNDELYLALGSLLDKSEAAVRRWVEQHHSSLLSQVATPTRENLTSTFVQLTCPVCLTFDCNLHGGGAESRVAPVKPRQFALARVACPWGRQCQRVANFDVVSHFTDQEEALTCCMLLETFPGAYCEVARIMNRSCAAIKGFAKAAGLAAEPLASNPPPSRKPPSKVEFSDFARADEHRVREPEPTYFVPCTHNGPCDQTCPCMQANEWCEKWCACSPTCKNLFPGCTCRGGCFRPNSCFCLSANRECDPELCECDAGKKEGRICRNVQLLHRESKQCFIGKSDIHGWGLFLGEPAKEGNLVIEYLGEIISEEEADRRGTIYDKQGHSFLFNFTEGFAIDSTRKGNRAKFINHSRENANMDAKTVFAAGERHLSFYAKRDIAAGEELLFDYAYPTEFEEQFLRGPRSSNNNNSSSVKSSSSSSLENADSHLRRKTKRVARPDKEKPEKFK